MTATTLLLHVGLPKTGTTSLQKWCDDNRGRLRESGIDYPATDPGEQARKHQFLVPELMSGVFDRTAAVLRAADPARRLLLSTEGLTNHLYDFPAESLARFRALTAGRKIKAFMVVRDRHSWLKSYHKQLVLNPPNPCFGYATPFSLDEFSRLPRVQRLLDHRQLVADVMARLNVAVVTAPAFEQDWFGAFRDWLGLDADAGWQAPSHEHPSCADEIVELVRLINGMGLAPDVRSHCLHALVTALADSGFEHAHTLSQISVFCAAMPDQAHGDAIWSRVVKDVIGVTSADSTAGRLARRLAAFKPT